MSRIDPVYEAGIESFPASDPPAWSTVAADLERQHLQFQLPDLPYGYADLEPVIDAETMELHYDKHHRAYVDGLNRALESDPQWFGCDIADVLSNVANLPHAIQLTVKNMGGGHANHSFFWKSMTPHGRSGPSGELLCAIESNFGSQDSMRAAFAAAGTAHFGSGWVLLAADVRERGKLDIVTLANQDTLDATMKTPLLACDLWEHSYYLRYRNRRSAWLEAWWEVVNWDVAAECLASAMQEGVAQ